MKSAILLILAGLTFFSCNKSNGLLEGFPEMEGNWRMLFVKDNATGQTFTKLASEIKDVDMTIRQIASNKGSIEGRTPRNTFGNGSIYLGENNTILITSMYKTDVFETGWGAYFLDDIYYSTEYKVSGNTLEIKTPEYTLIFMRL